VISTFSLAGGGSGYASAAGTSMAAPHVAGAVALLLAQGLAPPAAVNRLLATLDKGAACGRGCQGRLNLATAVGADHAAATAAAPPSTRAASTSRTTVPRSATTRPPTARPSTTTVPEAPPSTSTTVAPGSAQVTDTPEVAAPLPFPGGAGQDKRNPAVVATAVVLVIGTGVASSAAGVRRLRAGGPL
jgi:subtilisin family serine protease